MAHYLGAERPRKPTCVGWNIGQCHQRGTCVDFLALPGFRAIRCLIGILTRRCLRQRRTADSGDGFQSRLVPTICPVPGRRRAESCSGSLDCVFFFAQALLILNDDGPAESEWECQIRRDGIWVIVKISPNGNMSWNMGTKLGKFGLE